MYEVMYDVVVCKESRTKQQVGYDASATASGKLGRTRRVCLNGQNRPTRRRCTKYEVILSDCFVPCHRRIHPHEVRSVRSCAIRLTTSIAATLQQGYRADLHRCVLILGRGLFLLSGLM